MTETMLYQTIEQLYRDHAAALCAYLARHTTNIASPDDLCHDVFLLLLGGPLPRRRSTESELAWLQRLALMLMKQQARESTPMSGMPPHGGAALDVATAAAHRCDMDALLQRLPRDVRRPVLLRTAGYRVDEIARALGQSRPVIVRHLACARQRIAAHQNGS
jgi:DNA-directed RNA polymerase specialized sigma24 family protein